MRKATNKRRGYQFSLGEGLSVIAVFAASFGFIRWGLVSGGDNAFLLVLMGAVVAGAGIGAAIGRAFEDQRRGSTWMGAYLGAIAPLLAVAVACLLLIVASIAASVVRGLC